jgi:phosphopantothenoylcysteine decarboxylase/phosphopantothenate--cysteine ligase
MQQLANKRILLGVTGGIAAYKSAELARQLKKAGADVRVVMTAAACEFITPLTLQALSGNPVHTALLDPGAEAAMGHIELARWADAVVVAPATADFLARLAAGIANDLLTTLCLATPATVAVAPAMNQQMFRDSATQANLATLRARGIRVFGPAEGEQACGDVGPGRMIEPADIAAATADLFQSGKLTGLRVVVTAGPTREAIDPVRFISNNSSGKMGFAIAEACIQAGAHVTLVCGPVALTTPDRVRRLDVTKASEMHVAVMSLVTDCDIFIGTAAVADYAPIECADQKIKKSDEEMIVRLRRNPDIISDVAALPEKPFVVGFAAETRDVISYARDKLLRKNLDMIVANDVANARIGFNSENNAVTVISSDDAHVLAEAGKALIARQIIALVADRFHTTTSRRLPSSSPES